MKSYSKILTSKTRIQYQDCDPFNHLNNSRYIDYIMAARTEQLLDHFGFNTAEMVNKSGIGWVAAQTQISYFYPASWMEVVTIESRLIRFSASSLLVEAFMWDENKSKLKAVMWAKLVHFNIKSQTSQKHSDELMQLFAQILSPVSGDLTFEGLISSLKSVNQ